MMTQHAETCLGACVSCIEAFNTCFSRCLKEQAHHDLSGCIRLDRECADICDANRQPVYEANLRPLRRCV